MKRSNLKMKLHLLLSGLLLIVFLPTTGLSQTTITTRIINFSDDAEEDITGPTAGDVRRSSSDLEIGNENGVEQWVGLRFQALAIPQGSVINSASILFTVPAGQNPDVGTLLVPILGELDAESDEFGDLTPITGRTLTTATTTWDIDPWFANDSGPNTTTPDLSGIVQEVVDQGDWVSGGSITFVFQNDPLDTSERIAVSFDGDPNNSPQLTVDFTAPASIPGDFDNDGDVDCDDVDSYVGNLGSAATGTLAPFDLDGDSMVTIDDANLHISTLVETTNGQVGTFPGDLNCDGTVNVLGDAFVLVGSLGMSGTLYSEGDINFDGMVNVLGDAFVLVGNLGMTNVP